MKLHIRECLNCPRTFLLAKRESNETLCVACRAALSAVVMESEATAEAHGREDGRKNLHYVPKRIYKKSECYAAWLRGWRQGQVEFFEKQAARQVA